MSFSTKLMNVFVTLCKQIGYFIKMPYKHYSASSILYQYGKIDKFILFNFSETICNMFTKYGRFAWLTDTRNIVLFQRRPAIGKFSLDQAPR